MTLHPAPIRLHLDAAIARIMAIARMNASPTDGALVDGVPEPPFGQRVDGTVPSSPGGGGDYLHLLAVEATAATNNQYGGVTCKYLIHLYSRH